MPKYKFLESIKIAGLIPQNIAAHQERLNSTFQKVYATESPWKLEDLIKAPQNVQLCRFLYNQFEYEIEYKSYEPRKLQTLGFVDIGDYDYSLKYADRSFFKELLAKHPDYDDLILLKDGFITDCTYANLIFFNGHEWHTPATPLLAGTQRAQLIASGLISEGNIRPSDLNNYSHIKLINAMLEFDAQDDGCSFCCRTDNAGSPDSPCKFLQLGHNFDK